MQNKRKLKFFIYIVLCLILIESISRISIFHYELWQKFLVIKDFFQIKNSYWNFFWQFWQYRNIRRPIVVNDDYCQTYFVTNMPQLLLGGIRFSTNSFGMRNREVDLLKPEGIYRILWLGGSTLISGYHEETTAPAILEEKLNRLLPDRNFEVINGGVMSANVFDSFMTFALNWRNLKPDMLIIDHGINDIRLRRNSIHLQRWSSLEGSFWQLNKQLLKNNVKSFWQVLKRYIRFLRVFEILFLKRNAIHKITEPPRENLDAFEAQLEALVLIAKGSDCKVVLLSSQIIDPDKGNYSLEQKKALERYFDLHDSFRGFTKQGVLNTIKEINKIIENVARRNKFIFIDMSKAVPEDNKYFLDATHRSDEGNKIFADALMKELLPLLILDN